MTTNEIVSMHDLKNGDTIRCIAGEFVISGRRVSVGHRKVPHNVSASEARAIYDAPETSADCIVFDGLATKPSQQIQEWTLQGNNRYRLIRVKA